MLILQLVIIGLGITLEPVPLTAFILVLASEGGVRKGATFVVGWVASLVIVVAVTLLATDNSPPKPSTAPSIAALAVKLALGAVLLFVAWRRYRRLGQPKPPKKTPKWQAGIDSMSPLYATGLAPLVQPWGLIAAGVATIVDAKLSSWQDYLAIALFCLLATGTYLAMEIYAVRRTEATRAFLLRIRGWVDTHTDVLVVWVSLIVGLWLIGTSIDLLVT
jgi:threonine/homoserine/homoserine lactone efflux protein